MMNPKRNSPLTDSAPIAPLAPKIKRSSSYASAPIIARRQRILDEARKMIGEEGLASLAMDEVARRSDVAKRTLYNAFQSKEHLVAAAISNYFEDFEKRIDQSATDNTTISWMVERLVIIARRNLKIKNYTRALIGIYHAIDVDPEIRQAIHDIPARSHAPLIRHLAAHRQLQPWANPNALIAMLVRYRYAVAQAWVEGEISDDEFPAEVVRGFFTVMAGASRGKAHTEVIDLLRNLASHPLLKDAAE